MHSPANARRLRFVEEYLRDGRAKAAAVRAGYAEKGAAVTAWRLLHHPEIGALVRAGQRERSDRLRLSVDRIVREHARLALADVAAIVRFTRKGPRLRPLGELGPDGTAAIREVARVKGGFRVRLHDKQRSLDLLSRLLGVEEQFKHDASAAFIERWKETAKMVERFRSLVGRVTKDLNVPEDESPMVKLAHGVAMGDPLCELIAKKFENPTPTPPAPSPVVRYRIPLIMRT